MGKLTSKESEMYYDSGGNLHIVIYEDVSSPTIIIVPNSRNSYGVAIEFDLKEN